MSPLSLLLNILWVVTGGIWMAIAWLVAAVIMAITIVGLPWARAAVSIASYTFLPFGRVALARDEGRGGRRSRHRAARGGGQPDLAGAGGLVAGARHVITAITLAVTIIGLPFAWAHLKLALLSLWPIGRTIVSVEEAEVLRGRRV